jgi:hypothetical protein
MDAPAAESGAAEDGGGEETSEAGEPDSSGPSGPIDGSMVSQGDAAAPTGTLSVVADAALRTVGVPGGCAAITSFLAAPDEVTVGYSLDLSAEGIDGYGQTSDVTLSWTSSGGVGSLAAATGASNVFTCTSAGSATVAVSASLSAGGASCATTGTATLTLLCDAP